MKVMRQASTDWPIHPLIAGRWSPRAISGAQVSREMLGRLFEAARWAPSSFNEQPWRYFVATRDQPAAHAQLASFLVDANGWAKEAWLLGLSVAHVLFERNGKPNPHAFHDLGAASQNLFLQAADLGLAMHQMAGFDRVRAAATLALDESNQPVAMFALGWPADPATLPEPLREREAAPRVRRPLASFVFEGTWGTPASVR